MKKLLFVFPIVALLAAGCNSTQQASNQTPVQTPVTQTSTAPTATPASTSGNMPISPSRTQPSSFVLQSGAAVAEQQTINWNNQTYSLIHYCLGTTTHVHFNDEEYPNTPNDHTYCIGNNLFVLKDGTKLVEINQQNISSVDDAPVLYLFQNLNNGTILETYYADVCATEDNCGTGQPTIVNYAINLNNDTFRTLQNFPQNFDYTTSPLWNSSHTEAVFLAQGGGAGCPYGPILGYNLQDDTVTKTAQQGCISKGGLDVAGNPSNSWDNLHWVNDTSAVATFIPVKGTTQTVDIVFN